MGNERTTSVRSGHTLKFWRSAMLAGGWTEYGGVHAGITVSLSIASLPVRTPDPASEDDLLDGAVVCTQPPAITVSFPGGEVNKVWAYDPGVYEEPPCSAFPYGDTQGQTYDFFKSALAAATGMGIASEIISGGIAELRLESPAAGPDDNGTQIGGWVSGTVWYGGYRMRSGTYRERFLTVTGREGPGLFDRYSHAWEMLARVHHGDFDIFGGPAQRFDLWMDPAQSSAYGWRICVCPYQFAIWMDGRGDGMGALAGPQSAMVSMPWVPEGFTGHSAFAFVSTSNIANFRGDLEWDGHVWFSDGPWASPGFAAMIVPVMRSRPRGVDRLTTTQGFLPADNAWVTARRSGIARIDNRICGKLWNCSVVHDDYPVTTAYAEMSGGTWVRVSSQAEPQAASVWWKVTSGDLFARNATQGTSLPETGLPAVFPTA